MPDRPVPEAAARVPAWRSVLISAGTAVVLFALVELALLALGVPTVLESEDPFRGFSRHVSVFEKDSARGVHTCDREATRGTFNAQEFRIAKPPGGYRIFCIGGSSTYGFPWGAAAAFPAVLGDLLAAEHPERFIEVVNAAGVSYASHRLRILTRELAGYEPDLLIVYSGHNEFIEKRFYRSLRVRAEAVGPLDRWLVRSRLFATMKGWIDRRKDRTTRRDQEKLELIVRRDRGEPIAPSERDELVGFFTENLRAICSTARAAGAQVILCTTPANLREWRPARASGHPALSGDELAR